MACCPRKGRRRFKDYTKYRLHLLYWFNIAKYARITVGLGIKEFGVFGSSNSSIPIRRMLGGLDWGVAAPEYITPP
ncbi:MAG: hypothetical protein SPJ08_04830 [Sphaerochaetaceae bacterium]|nr:hypothetical protein [Sphaerochaetaceae bacterium]